MKGRTRILTAMLLLAICGGAGSASAEGFVFPSRNRMVLAWSARVARNIDGTFGYFYKLRSDRTSKQTVDLIWLEQKGDKKPTILNPPPWTREALFLTRNSSVSWGAGAIPPEGSGDEVPPVNSIGPGQTSPEFGILNSTSPPGINKFLVKGYAPAPVYDEGRDVIIVEGKEFSGSEWASRIMDSSTELPNGKIEEDGVSGFTVGPRTPDADPCQFCITIALDIIKAGKLGWIGPDSPAVGPKSGSKDKPSSVAPPAPRIHVAMTFHDQLLNARLHCVEKRYEPASKILVAMLRENCALWGKQVNDEAYYLIKFNGEYLLEKFGHPELAPSCGAPTGSLAVHVTKKGVKGGVVNAQGIEVTVTSKDGAIVRSGKTGWGASSGEAVFEDLPLGEYTVKANGKTTRATVEKGNATEVEVGP